MLLGKMQLLHDFFLVLDHALMLDLCSLCEQRMFFIIQCTHKLVTLINSTSLW